MMVFILLPGVENDQKTTGCGLNYGWSLLWRFALRRGGYFCRFVTSKVREKSGQADRAVWRARRAHVSLQYNNVISVRRISAAHSASGCTGLPARVSEWSAWSYDTVQSCRTKRNLFRRFDSKTDSGHRRRSMLFDDVCLLGPFIPLSNKIGVEW